MGENVGYKTALVWRTLWQRLAASTSTILSQNFYQRFYTASKGLFALFFVLNSQRKTQIWIKIAVPLKTFEDCEHCFESRETWGGEVTVILIFYLVLFQALLKRRCYAFQDVMLFVTFILYKTLQKKLSSQITINQETLLDLGFTYHSSKNLSFRLNYIKPCIVSF